MPEERQAHPQNLEPYKISDMFLPEYEGNQLVLNTFISGCNTAYSMAENNQQTLQIENKLSSRAAELISSRNKILKHFLKHISEIRKTCPQ